MGHFYFARHGQTVWNVENKICGATDIELTELGHQQAEELGQAILEQGIQIDEILYSPLIRAKETARHVSEVTGIPLARWADVLLMYAEAEVRKTGTVPSVAAINAVNQVRKRAGLSDLPSVTTNTKDAFLNAILIERGHEFFYEGNRKIDLIRFNKYAQEMYKAKGIMPTHQYMPIPNYAVEQAISYGKELKQTWERPGWAEDKSKAQQSIN